MLKGATLCSGIGAPECAAPDIDWIWSSDIEPFPNAVRAVRFPDSINLGDMTAEDFVARAAAIGLPDVLVAGTPCQAFSVAGLRQSLADDRGNLTLLFVRICDAIDDLRRAAGLDPLWIVWENVPGVLSVKDNAFGSLLAGLGGHDAPITPIGRGRWSNAGVVAGPKRGVAWRILDAQHFGVAQRRRRVFIVARGGVGNWDGADALLPLIDSLQRHPAPSRKTGQKVARGFGSGAAGNRGAGWPADLACTLDADFASKYGQNNQHINSGCPLFVPDIASSLGASPACGTSVNVANGQGTVIAVDTYNASVGNVAPALCTQGDHASGNGAVMLYPAHALTTQCGSATEDGTGRGSPLVCTFLHDPSPTLDASYHKGAGERNGIERQIVSVAAVDIYNASIGEVAPTMGTGNDKPHVMAFHPTQDPISSIDISHALGTGSAGGQASVAVAFSIQERAVSHNPDVGPQSKGYQPDIAYTLEARSQTQAVAFTQNTRDEVRLINGDGQIAGALAAQPGMKQTTYISEIARSLTARYDGSPCDDRGPNIIATSAVRRLTPRECERLQGFPDDWTAITVKDRPAADAPRYKALGNSMAVPVMRYILDRVKEVNDAA